MGRGNTRKTGGVFLVVGTVQHECTDCGDVTLFTAPPEFSVQEKNRRVL
jgi:rRNA maturation protein Nop10